MKGITKLVLSAILTVGIVSGSWAAAFPKKNPPKNNRAVEEILKAAGGTHYPKHLKITGIVGSIKTQSTWFHVWGAYDRDSQTYRAIFFDNTPKYLGYYDVPYEPSGTEQGALDLNDPTGSSDSGQFQIPVTDKGPPTGFSFPSGYTANFVKAPAPKGATAAKEPTKPEATSLPSGGAATNSAASTSKPTETKPAAPAPKKIAPKYREWTVTMDGKQISFSAVFVKYDKFKKLVTLKSAKTGTTADIDVGKFSMKDKKYLANLLEK